MNKEQANTVVETILTNTVYEKKYFVLDMYLDDTDKVSLLLDTINNLSNGGKYWLKKSLQEVIKDYVD